MLQASTRLIVALELELRSELAAVERFSCTREPKEGGQALLVLNTSAHRSTSASYSRYSGVARLSHLSKGRRFTH